MKSCTKILSAFIIGSTAGTLLGMLMNSPADSKSKEAFTERKNKGNSFIKRFFSKGTAEPAGDGKQNAGEYEEA